jgi:hypothetical protein
MAYTQVFLMDFPNDALFRRLVRFELAPRQLPLVALVMEEYDLGVTYHDPLDRDREAVG